MAGCARRQPPAAAPALADALCGAPHRVIVAEAAGQPYAALATDELAAGLSGLGFQVLAPRRVARPLASRVVNDWIFTPEVARDAAGAVQINVELYSLKEARRVWAITDALSDQQPADEREAVRLGVRTAIELFQTDRLGCRAAREAPLAAQPSTSPVRGSRSLPDSRPGR